MCRSIQIRQSSFMDDVDDEDRPPLDPDPFAPVGDDQSGYGYSPPRSPPPTPQQDSPSPPPLRRGTRPRGEVTYEGPDEDAAFSLIADVPATGDFALYLYSGERRDGDIEGCSSQLKVVSIDLQVGGYDHDIHSREVYTALLAVAQNPRCLCPVQKLARATLHPADQWTPQTPRAAQSHSPRRYQRT